MAWTRALSIAAVVASASCLKAPAAPPPEPSPSPSPTPGGPRAAAFRVTSEADLIGGLTAKGRVGDFKLHNDKVAVIIGNEAHGEGYSPYGGAILDADLVRGPGVPGESRFGEILMSFDLKIVRPSSVIVVADGSDGRAAIIEVNGSEASLPLLEALLPDYILGRPRDLALTIRYTLEPGSSEVLVDYELHNRGSNNAEMTVGIVGFLFGDGALPFVPGFGFAPPKNGSVAGYYGALGEKVSYLFGRRSGPLGYIAEYSAILAAKHADSMTIYPGVKKRLAYALIIGGGDLAATQGLWRAAVALTTAQSELIGRPGALPSGALHSILSGAGRAPPLRLGGLRECRATAKELGLLAESLEAEVDPLERLIVQVEAPAEEEAE